jgi:hypothetical protein
MATTTNYGWTTPDDTALVKDGASAIRTLGSSVDTTVKALNPGTTSGDIDYYTSSTAKARLAKGTAGQVLQMNSGATAPEWATPSSGGMTLISTTSLSGASVALTSIPSTYNHLQLIIRGFRPSTDNSQLQMRLQNDTTASRHRSAYGAATSTLGAGGASFGDNLFYICDGNDNTAATGFFLMNFFDYANTSTWKTIQFQWWFPNATTPTTQNFGVGWGAYNQTVAIDQINLFTSSGNIAGGTALLYGVK